MINITMPKLGESVTEGTISRWIKKVGDSVAEYEALLEVTTDKVDTEVPAPVSGIVSEILVPEGKTVPVGTLIARLAVEAGALDAPAVQVSTALIEAAFEGQADITATMGRRQAGAPPISPVVARLVAEHNLDLSQITGTGQSGRISKQDVLRYLEQQPAPISASISVASPTLHIEQPRPSPTAIPAPVPGTASASTAHTPELADDIELVPLTPMRRIIAEHMLRSVRETPHVTTVFEIDMQRVAEQRAEMRAEFEHQGVRLTYMAYILEVVAHALQAVPVLNGRYTESGIVLNKSVHLGIAVAIEDGLFVPVLRDANAKSLLGLARSLSELSDRARRRRLKPDETQGGTFSITNHGAGGSLIGTPIINQPQSGILGIGAIVKRPVVISQHGSDAIAIRPMCYFSLTFDHRVCDGAQADAFMSIIKSQLEKG